MVRLVEEVSLAPFDTFHMDGHWDATGTAITDAIVRSLGDPAVPVRQLPWWLLNLAVLFVATPRELVEMRYLWREPVRLENARLLATRGQESRTPLDEPVRKTLEALGCLTPARDRA